MTSTAGEGVGAGGGRADVYPAAREVVPVHKKKVKKVEDSVVGLFPVSKGW